VPVVVGVVSVVAGSVVAVGVVSVVVSVVGVVTVSWTVPVCVVAVFPPGPSLAWP
jgi:hypothetical protein